MKLTEKSMQVFDYVKKAGGKVTIDELASALDREARSINASVNDLAKKELAMREKVEIEGAEKPVTYVVLTAEGKTFVPSED